MRVQRHLRCNQQSQVVPTLKIISRCLLEMDTMFLPRTSIPHSLIHHSRPCSFLLLLLQPHTSLSHSPIHHSLPCSFLLLLLQPRWQFGPNPGQRMHQVLSSSAQPRGFMPVNNNSGVQRPGMSPAQPSSPTRTAPVNSIVTPPAPPPTVQTVDTSNAPSKKMFLLHLII